MTLLLHAAARAHLTTRSAAAPSIAVHRALDCRSGMGGCFGWSGCVSAGPGVGGRWVGLASGVPASRLVGRCRLNLFAPPLWTITLAVQDIHVKCCRLPGSDANPECVLGSWGDHPTGRTLLPDHTLLPDQPTRLSTRATEPCRNGLFCGATGFRRVLQVRHLSLRSVQPPGRSSRVAGKL